MTVIPVNFAAPPPAEGFRSLDVCKIADVSYRQIDYWDRIGLAEPSVKSASGSGTQRLYSDADVLRVCVIKTLLDAGFALSDLRKSVPHVLQTASGGVGFFSAPNVVVTVDIGSLQSRIEEWKLTLAEQHQATS